MDPSKLALVILLLISFSCRLHVQPRLVTRYPKPPPPDYPTANLSTLWTSGTSISDYLTFSDGSKLQPILLRRSSGNRFGCGFFCNGTSDSYLLATFHLAPEILLGYPPQVFWSANRNNPVQQNATLQLTEDGDLLLRDVDGTKVWSTNTSGKSVVGMNMSETGNLVLFNRNNSIIWQSFDHPTDSLLLGQKLMARQRLTASVSASNLTQGQFYLSVNANGLSAFILQADTPEMYYKMESSGTDETREPSYVIYTNRSLDFFKLSPDPKFQDSLFLWPQPSSVQFIRLEYDGHLRLYQWDFEWRMVEDLFTSSTLGECVYPTVCGNYGICSNGGQCSCPRGTDGDYFTQLDIWQPSLGCSAITPLSCQTPQYHQLLDLADISYFNYVDDNAAVLKGTDVESCKDACLNNCSCKAALFKFLQSCYLPSQLFSLINIQNEETNVDSSAFIKVHIPPIAPIPDPINVSSPKPVNGSHVSTLSRKKTSRMAALLGSTLGALFGACLIIGTYIMLFRKKNAEEEVDDDCFDQVPGMPMRFSYENLKAATRNFCNKLGGGGFGSVFEGTLTDGTKVAVKRLDGVGQGKKEFLAEVETIGNVHHVNLVRLIGFCAEKSYRLLVYEYLCNGSLDKWIFFHKHQTPPLEWKTRQKIITDIAKGLAYLHEECRQRIAHLDIKPRNILLDKNLNVKISDFGLSKLIDRDQSAVMTRMRGTPGYLAPEWLTSKITEKVDVYSFGIVVLEIVCARKNLDYSQSEENIHLLSLLKRKAEEDRLVDVVDKHNQDMQFHEEEIMKAIKIAVWCLQGDFTRRPSMSVVVKVLDGVMDVEPGLDYSFSTWTQTVVDKYDGLGVSAPPMASVLSGPR